MNQRHAAKEAERRKLEEQAFPLHHFLGSQTNVADYKKEPPATSAHYAAVALFFVIALGSAWLQIQGFLE